ncbi:uncharacterized protein ASPGLDRAFT_40998 [Aspergillus glaucus CBS 516.65]|uniref:Secreted protein n=1 Tax=Aspergillus glaucus CBS 516.65 TaxID=1160497 RepID=A0A1L9VYT5_ASPGL|nr:hypothetical protein ASPGLDRAFT_40998 [Aspergillus glaucus CBS 516.65]OJJ89074.1 hypothetical protein ASPGLDRAFT_40998 [Aspergillus glaucus CBS 516.65]
MIVGLALLDCWLAGSELCSLTIPIPYEVRIDNRCFESRHPCTHMHILMNLPLILRTIMDEIIETETPCLSSQPLTPTVRRFSLI